MVNEDKTEAAVGWFRVLSGSNQPYTRMRLKGLDEAALYDITVRREKNKPYGNFYGDELMHIGLLHLMQPVEKSREARDWEISSP